MIQTILQFLHSLTGWSWVPNDDNQLLEISEFRGYEGRKLVCKTDEIQTVLMIFILQLEISA